MTRDQLVERIAELRKELRGMCSDQSGPTIDEINRLTDQIVNGEYDDAEGKKCDN
jgi:hypothetical protein